MEPIIKHIGVAAPLNRSNIDTDAIIPKQFLRKIERTGFGVHLFHEWRYTDYEGTKENPEFLLNKKEYRNSSIIVARDNFGCGSSREHAPWALYDFGIRVIIAPSFADIFFNNCTKNGILLVKLSEHQVAEIFNELETNIGIKITADLENQIITMPSGKEYAFEANDFSKYCLLKGLDHIDWSLQFEDKIVAFENKTKKEKPWLV